MKDLPDNAHDDDIEKILGRLGTRPRPEPAMTDAVRANVLDAWQQEVRQNQLQQNRRHRYLRVAAAVGALAFAGMLAVSSLEQPAAIVATVDGPVSSSVTMQYSIDGEQWQDLSNSDIAVGDYLRTGSEAAASLTFSNNMNVRLDRTTLVQISSPNSVKLTQGNVYLDSYGEVSAQGFVVETPFGKARDIGTQFMVQSTADSWSVQVREGKVNVDTPDSFIAVTPGERVTITAENTVTKAQVLPTDDSWRWTESAVPAYSLSGKSVDDYLQWVARETGRTVTYTNETQHQTALRTRLSGSQSIDGLSASESLPHILQTTQLELVELNDSMITIGAHSID